MIIIYLKMIFPANDVKVNWKNKKITQIREKRLRLDAAGALLGSPGTGKEESIVWCEVKVYGVASPELNPLVELPQDFALFLFCGSG